MPSNNAYGPNIVTDGLELCLDANNAKSYPGAGTTWTSLAPARTALVPDLGTPIFVSSPIKCFDFEGQAAGADNLKSSTILAGSNTQTEYTRMAWFSTDDSGGSWGGPLIQNSIGNNADMCLMVGSSKLKFYHYNASGGESGQSASSTLSNGVWYCGAVSVSRNSSSDNLHFFLNGEADGTANRTDMNNASSSTVIVGGPDSDSYTGGRYFNGKIAVVYHYNRILSHAEIKQNYNALRSRFGL